MLLARVFEQGSESPVDVGGEAVLAGDEPGGDACGDGVDFEPHGDFAAVGLFRDGFPFVVVRGFVEGEAFDDEADFLVVEGFVGEVEFLHEAEEVILHGAGQVSPELAHVLVSEDAGAVDDFGAFQDFADVFGDPLGFEDDGGVEFWVVVEPEDFAQFVEPAGEDAVADGGDALVGHDLPEVLGRGVFVAELADFVGGVEPGVELHCGVSNCGVGEVEAIEGNAVGGVLLLEGLAAEGAEEAGFADAALADDEEF